jgi:hypothetical protein
MEQRISTRKLDKLYRDEIKKHGKSSIEDIVKAKRLTEDGRGKMKSIFLCHSHHDKTIVEKMILLFNKIDVNIYVDWMDEAMPKVTNRDTAEIIKNKIQHCSRFVFLASYFGLKSKWCDWELGVAYSTKAIDELAILPIESKSGNWQGSEYLQLYPIMLMDGNDLNEVTSDKVTIVKNGTPNPVSLQQWLTT